MSFFANLMGGTLQGAGVVAGAGARPLAAPGGMPAAERPANSPLPQSPILRQPQQSPPRQVRVDAGEAQGGSGINLARMAYGLGSLPAPQGDAPLAGMAPGGDAAGVPFPLPDGSTPRLGSDTPPTTTRERAAYDADKGVQALQRAYAVFTGPAEWLRDTVEG